LKRVVEKQNLGLLNAHGKIVLLVLTMKFSGDFENNIWMPTIIIPRQLAFVLVEGSNGLLFKKYPSQTKLQVNNLDILIFCPLK
jgi:hypothetical protein